MGHSNPSRFFWLSCCAGKGANITYNSQSTFVLPLEFEDGTVLFIYMGDRWNFYGSGQVLACAMPASFKVCDLKE